MTRIEIDLHLSECFSEHIKVDSFLSRSEFITIAGRERFRNRVATGHAEVYELQKQPADRLQS